MQVEVRQRHTGGANEWITLEAGKGLMKEMQCRSAGKADRRATQVTGPGLLNRYKTGAEGK